jgi:hypothetical protein
MLRAAYGPNNPPPASEFWRHIDHARAAGLIAEAQQAYAAMMWWGQHYGFQPARITSGKRDDARQRALLAEWNQHGRNGPNRLVVRPAYPSHHTAGRAWDVERVPHLWVYDHFAQFLGVRAGSKFSAPDPIHYDLGS